MYFSFTAESPYWSSSWYKMLKQNNFLLANLGINMTPHTPKPMLCCQSQMSTRSYLVPLKLFSRARMQVLICPVASLKPPVIYIPCYLNSNTDCSATVNAGVWPLKVLLHNFKVNNFAICKLRSRLYFMVYLFRSVSFGVNIFFRYSEVQQPNLIFSLACVNCTNVHIPVC